MGSVSYRAWKQTQHVRHNSDLPMSSLMSPQQNEAGRYFESKKAVGNKERDPSQKTPRAEQEKKQATYFIDQHYTYGREPDTDIVIEKESTRRKSF